MDEVRGEPRWPMSLAVVFVIVLIDPLPERADLAAEMGVPRPADILLSLSDHLGTTKTEREWCFLSS